MMMWSCRAIVRAAIWVTCAARASQSLAVSVRTIGSPNWIRTGAASIEMIIAASTGCSRPAGRMSFWNASASITSASSPACAR